MTRIRKLRRISLETATALINHAEERYVNKKDFVDKGIEPKIRPVVIVLVAHGFPTESSCEGHLESNLYPWVRFQPSMTGGSKSALLRHLAQIHYEVERLRELLGEFWENSPRLTPDRELAASPEWDVSIKSDKQVAEEYLAMRAKRFVALPGYWLQCSGAEALSTLPDELIRPHRKNILKHRQQDMLAFGQFLASKIDGA